MNSVDVEPQLVADVIEGDPIALQALLVRCRLRLLAYIRRQMPTAIASFIEPEDVLQDTCIEAFRRMGQFTSQGDDAPMRWLMTIARHRIVDLVRAQSAAKRGGGATVHRDRDDDTGVVSLLEKLAIYHRTPSKSAAAPELAFALERSIDRLPPDYRQAICLRHVDGLAGQEASTRT